MVAMEAGGYTERHVPYLSPQGTQAEQKNHIARAGWDGVDSNTPAQMLSCPRGTMLGSLHSWGMEWWLSQGTVSCWPVLSVCYSHDGGTGYSM